MGKNKQLPGQSSHRIVVIFLFIGVNNFLTIKKKTVSRKITPLNPDPFDDIDLVIRTAGPLWGESIGILK